MSFFRSILLVAGVAACVSFALFAGYALSAHHMKPVYIGLAALAGGAALLFLFSWTDRAVDESTGSGQ